MKNLIISLSSYLICLCLLNFQFAEDLSEFGISIKNTEERLWSGIQSERLYIPYVGSAVKDACKSIPPENQAAAVNKMGGFMKSYFTSEDFQKRYSDWLSKSFPQTEATISEKRKAEIRAYRLKDVQNLTVENVEPLVEMQIQSAETFAGMENMLSSLPAEQRADFKKQIENGKKNAAFFKKVKPLLKSDFPEFKKQYAEHLALDEIAQAEQQLVARNKSNAIELQKWQDPKKVLSARLTEFLEKSKGVDFEAQTKDVNNRKKFVNGAYESKSDIWKFCYRIGKTPTNTARAFAQQWLAELK